MQTINLENKRVLYIGPVRFQYDQELIKRMSLLGADVEAFGQYPDTLNFKILKKLKLPSLKKYLEDFYNKALVKGNKDYVLIRHGHMLPVSFLERLKKNNPNARFINFHWDSLKPAYNYLPVIKYFDKVYSFDYKDARENPGVHYLPLFYLDDYAEHKKQQQTAKNEYDLLFIGAWRNTERLELIKQTDKICRESQLKFVYYLHASIQWQYDYFKQNRSFPKEARSKSLSHSDILEYFSKTSCIIDFPSSFQTGLTIRTFETLGAGKKLITTNKNIITEPFYNPEFISIVDPENLQLDVDFINNKPQSSIEEALKDYSINSYIYKLLES